MIEKLKESLRPAKDALNGIPPAWGTQPLNATELRTAFDSIVATLDTLTTALEAFAASQTPAIVQVPMNTPLVPAEPGLIPNPASSPPTELNPSPAPV